MSKKKILIVDDIYANRLLLIEIIKIIGFEYVQVENGKQALKALEENDIAMILMDLEMPVMNGIETTKYIREKLGINKNKIPIIAITAHNPQTFFEEYFHAGFNELITKPYSLEKISNVISSFALA